MIVCHELCAGYDGRTVLRGVDFQASAGESVALLGPNGSGKTTLLRVLSGVLEPRAGTVTLCGTPLKALSPRHRARRIAVVPQRTEDMPRLRVGELVLLGRYPYLSWLGNYSAADQAAARGALEVTGAASLADRPVRELSGGELQRVLLARALAQETPVLLLDELSAGLDMARMVELFDLLEGRRADGTCLVTVMHDLNLAALYATRLVGLKAGGVIFNGSVRDVFTEELLSGLYETPIHVFPHPVLGVPQACPGRRNFGVGDVVRHAAAFGTAVERG